MIFELFSEFSEAVEAIPLDHARKKPLALIAKSLGYNINFIDRHPTTLFQFIWNSCWWHGVNDTAVDVSQTLCKYVEAWRIQKEQTTPGFLWVRSLLPPYDPIRESISRVFCGHEDAVMAVEFSPDGKFLASGAWSLHFQKAEFNKTIIWLTANGVLQQELVNDGSVRTSRFGLECVNSGCGSRNCETMTSVHCLAYHPSGRRIAAGSWDHHIRVWDIETGIKVVCIHGHSQTVTSVAYSSEGNFLASSSVDGSVRIWNANTYAPVDCHNCDCGAVWSVAFSPNGRSIAIGSDDSVLRIWNLTGDVVRTSLRGHTSQIDCVAFSPDGRWLASGSHDGTVRLWDCYSSYESTCLNRHSGVVRAVAFSSDGQTLVSGGDDRSICVWDLSTLTHRVFYGHEAAVRSLSVSPVGDLVASGSFDRTVRIWSIKSAPTDAKITRMLDEPVDSIGFSVKGDRLLVRRSDGSINVVNTGDGRILRSEPGHCDVVTDIAFSKDARFVISGSIDGTIRKWTTSDGAHVSGWFAHSKGVNCVEFAHRGHILVSGGNDNAVRLWDTTTVESIACINHHVTPVTDVAFSPDDLQIASASDRDDCGRIWSTENQVERFRWYSKAGPITSLAYAQFGNQLAYGTSSGQVEVLDTSTGRVIYHIIKLTRPF